ncbi:MAG: hypothetical protein D8M58_19175 [Calditrichaeota bacterium]|nr:MAG: hypothetical protein DWQ03_21855 [Calditrichota bacterium]MBL1207534.1 hypothetical protein [Calditrichota bacterium]NOG47366.1 hypothetical protein [Calditrichota bacterium]
MKYICYLFIISNIVFTPQFSHAVDPAKYFFPNENKLNFFMERFRNNENNWISGEWDNRFAKINSVDGYHIKSDSQVWVYTKSVPFDQGKNWEIETAFKYVSGPNEKFGNFLEFGYKNDKTSYYFGIKNNQIKIGRSIEGKVLPILDYTYNETLKDNYWNYKNGSILTAPTKFEWTKLTIRKYKNEMFFFVNEKLVARIEAGLFPLDGNRIGFHCTAGNEIKVRFLDMHYLFEKKRYLYNRGVIYYRLQKKLFRGDYLKNWLQKSTQDAYNFNGNNSYTFKVKTENKISFANKNLIDLSKPILWNQDTTNLNLKASLTLKIDFVISKESDLFGIFFKFNNKGNSGKAQALSIWEREQYAEYATNDFFGKIQSRNLEYTFCQRYLREEKNELIIQFAIPRKKALFWLNGFFLSEMDLTDWNQDSKDFKLGEDFLIGAQGVGNLLISAIYVYNHRY